MTNHRKQKTRREFLQTGAKAGAIMYLLSNPILSSGTKLFADSNVSPVPDSKKLNILILGGTTFLGPHQIAYALERGHTISIFTRGKTNPTIYKDLFEKVEHLTGDREDNLKALEGRQWDAVIDNSGRKVKWTKDTAQLLKGNVEQYLYTSSTGVYYPYLGSDIKEDTELVLKVPENINEEQEMEYGYGVMKANSEREVIKAFAANKSIIVRPTYMMGPADRTDRFTYWPVRLEKGGEVMVPGKVDDPVQYIDVRDVAQWMIRLIENKNAGTFNAVGPASATGMMQFVYGAHAAFSSEATFVNIPDYDFLLKNNVPYSVPWIMPTGENFGSARTSNAFSVRNGLTYTPLAKSCNDIVEWWYSDAVSEERRAKLATSKDSLMAREKAILKAWSKR